MSTFPPQPAGASAADVAAAIVGTPTPATGTTPGVTPVGRQFGVVISNDGGTPPTATITMAGSSAHIPLIKFTTAYTPKPGDTCILDQVGSDVIINGALATGAAGPSGGPVPVGCMLAFPAALTDPAWLLCNGGSFSAVTYPALNTFLGGTTLPDARGVALMGAGVNGIVLGTRNATGASAAHVHTGAAHTHTSAAHAHSHSHSHSHAPSGGGGFVVTGALDGPQAGASFGASNATTDTDATVDATSTTPGPTGAASAANTGNYGSGTANVPPNLGVNVYIRAL